MEMSHFAITKMSWLALCLLLLAVAYWIVRGPVRAFRSSADYNDFLSPYVQTRVWLSGENPYDLGVLIQAWPYHGPSLKQNLISRGIPSPYPITGFPLLAPLAALPWNQANLLWRFTEILCFAVFLVSLLSLAHDSEAGSRYFLVLSALALAPFHTAVAVENVALPALALVTAAMVCERKNAVAAGILLACGLALKPTVAAPVFAYFLIRKRWSSVFVSVAVCLFLLITAAGRMMVSGTEWFPNYLANGRHLFDPGTVYDFSDANPLRFDLVNAQVIFSQFMTRPLAQYFAIGITALAILAWLQLRRKVEGLLDLSVLSVAVLVPLYHRFYDAALLMFPVAWAIMAIRGAAARYARIILIAAVPFLVPGAALLRVFEQDNSFVAALSGRWWWSIFVAAHQAWLILAILIALLFAVRKLSQPKAQFSAIESTPVAA